MRAVAGLGGGDGGAFDRSRSDKSFDEYFGYYAMLSQQQNMLCDFTRTGTYQHAMLANGASRARGARVWRCAHLRGVAAGRL